MGRTEKQRGSRSIQIRDWPFGSALAMMVMSVMLVLLFVYVVVSGRRGLDAAAGH